MLEFTSLKIAKIDIHGKHLEFMGFAFGPVPSRRLGRSLGVNNIPDKICTYACVYCQIGSTLRMEVERRKFYDPKQIYSEVERRLTKDVDYITIVPDGEPTLDINLGKLAEMLKNLNEQIAIITNSSLLPREDVRHELSEFDFVSLKLDAVSERVWKTVNRPHKSLDLQSILQSMLEFRDAYQGKLVTETMLIGGLDYGSEIEKIAEFLKELNPDVAYIATPIRPPAERWVKLADEKTLTLAHLLFSQYVKTEFLTGYEGSEFSATGNFVEDILSITAVHPMREDAVLELLRKDNADEKMLTHLVETGKIKVVEYNGAKYYMRALPSRRWM